MTLERLQKYIDGIDSYVQEKEYKIARIKLNKLMRNFILYVQLTGSPELQLLASEIINNKKLEFARWHS